MAGPAAVVSADSAALGAPVRAEPVVPVRARLVPVRQLVQADLLLRLAVLVPDTTMDPRWRRYQRAAAQRGNRSILAVTLLADRDATAVLTFSSTSREAFDDGAVAACGALAVRAAKVMRLAVRLDSAKGLNRDLLQAMRSRTAINLATGILMAQSRCSQTEAFELLAKVSNTRNVKLRVIAEEILRRFDVGPAGTAFSA